MCSPMSSGTMVQLYPHGERMYLKRSVNSLRAREEGKFLLSITVPVDIKLDTIQVSELVDKCSETQILRSISRRLASVGLGARIWRSTFWIGIPHEGPISIDVNADAGLICRWRWRGHAVLAPETFGCLGVYKACGS